MNAPTALVAGHAAEGAAGVANAQIADACVQARVQSHWAPPCFMNALTALVTGHAAEGSAGSASAQVADIADHGAAVPLSGGIEGVWEREVETWELDDLGLFKVLVSWRKGSRIWDRISRGVRSLLPALTVAAISSRPFCCSVWTSKQITLLPACSVATPGMPMIVTNGCR